VCVCVCVCVTGWGRADGGGAAKSWTPFSPCAKIRDTRRSL